MTQSRPVVTTIPPSTTAVELPDGRSFTVGPGVHSWTS